MVGFLDSAIVDCCLGRRVVGWVVAIVVAGWEGGMVGKGVLVLGCSFAFAFVGWIG